MTEDKRMENLAMKVLKYVHKNGIKYSHSISSFKSGRCIIAIRYPPNNYYQIPFETKESADKIYNLLRTLDELKKEV